MAAYNRFDGITTLADLEGAYEAALETAREEHNYSEGDVYEYNTRLNFIEDDYDTMKQELSK